MKRTFKGAFGLGAVLLLGACGDENLPTAQDARTLFQQSKPWGKRIDQGLVKLLDFEETGSQRRRIGGQTLFRLTFAAELVFTEAGAEQLCQHSTVEGCALGAGGHAFVVEGEVLFDNSGGYWEKAGLVLH